MTTKKYAYFTPLSPLIFAWLDYATEQRRKHGRFLYEIGDKEYAIALQIPWTPMTTYFLVQQTWQPCPQPSVQLLSTWEGRISTKGDLPSDQQSFLGTPVIPVLVCLRCDKQPRPMPTKSSGKKEDMKRGAVAGRQKFHFISIKKKKKKNRVLITRVSAENDLVRRSQVLHLAESDCVRRGRVSTHVQHRAR